MSFRFLSLVCSALIISVLGICLGAPNLKNVEVKQEIVREVSLVKVDPEGTLEEQLAYHESEIKKYQEACIKEETNANLYLIQNQMNNVRQSNSRKFQYMNKIKEHKEAIEELKNEQ
jgi:hypothetical protein